MPFREALFWVGITVFGTGLYLATERGNQSMLLAIAMIVIGLGFSAYAVIRHHYPDRNLPPIRPLIILLFILLSAVGYDIYMRWHPIEKIVEKPVPYEFAWTGDHAPTKQVKDRAFVRERVRLDDTEYWNCTFEEVTFVYNGIAPYRIHHYQIIGS